MDQIVAHSREAIVKGSSSFQSASCLLDKTLRQDVWQLYAWCRYCDDEIDGQDHGHGAIALSDEERRTRLERLRNLTKAALAGAPVDEPAFVAFQRVASRHRIPSEWPFQLLDGFAMDVTAREYVKPEETLYYCWSVAGVVGVMMASIMGTRDRSVLRRAQDLGIAFQLTNICRDIAEDARNGRVYLPSAWLASAGVPATPDAVLQIDNRRALFGVVRELLMLAELYYSSSRVGLRYLPFRAALAIAVARGIYREIGRRILRQGPTALARRSLVPKPVRLLLFLRGALVALWSRVEIGLSVPERPPLWSQF